MSADRAGSVVSPRSKAPEDSRPSIQHANDLDVDRRARAQAQLGCGCDCGWRAARSAQTRDEGGLHLSLPPRGDPVPSTRASPKFCARVPRLLVSWNSRSSVEPTVGRRALGPPSSSRREASACRGIDGSDSSGYVWFGTSRSTIVPARGVAVEQELPGGVDPLWCVLRMCRALVQAHPGIESGRGSWYPVRDVSGCCRRHAI